jgi:NAD(P)-dependent dehydrogenase (short-subunit alcohol dehydrogenase family)
MADRQKNGRLAGRVALITGASRGIGAAVARRFAAEGAHVVLVARTVGGLEEVDDQVRAVGGSATLVPLDLTEFDKIDQMGAGLYERFGRLDILVGNAGHLGSLGPMSHQDPNVFKRVIETNLIANWRLIRSMEPLLKLAPAGRALFTSCAAGREPTAYWSAYAVSKAALEMMARTWAAELTKTNVKVALVDPGPVATQLRRTAFPGENQAVMAQPDDVAGLYLEQALA